jgi:hypothetical protein
MNWTNYLSTFWSFDGVIKLNFTYYDMFWFNLVVAEALDYYLIPSNAVLLRKEEVLLNQLEEYIDLFMLMRNIV